MKTKQLLHYIFIALLAVSITACGDSGTDSGGQGEAPSFPNLAEYSQPDVSYFGGFGTKAPEVSASPNFAAAQGLVLGFSSLSLIGQIYTGFFEGARGEDASFNDGVYEWSYTYSFGGNSSEIRLTAEELSSSINWDLFLSIDTPELSFNDYNLMTGTTRNEGLEGEWTFNTFLEGSTGSRFLQSNWVVGGEDEQTNDLVIFDEEGTAQVSIDFGQTGSEFLLGIDFSNESDSDAEIFWDTDADIGYVEQDGERNCWQGNGQNATDVPCASVNL